MKKRYIFGVLLAATALVGCTSPGGITSSTHYLGNNTVTAKGPAEGTQTHYRVLFFPVGKADLDEAINKAVKNAQADALVNVRWYRQDFNILLFSMHTIIVTGEAVTLSQLPAESGKK